MNMRDARGMTIMGLAIGGTLVAGGLLALTVPTSMLRTSEDWHQTLGVHTVSADGTTIPIYAPPQDLTPVHWQTAAEEYPSMPPQDHWSDVLADVPPDQGDDSSAYATSDTLPPELTQASASDAQIAVAGDDAAASSAEAARVAAADVRAQENAATDVGATTVPHASPAPQAATGTT